MSEQEAAKLKDYIVFLEGENAQLAAHNAELQDQMEAMNSMLNQPDYD